MKLLKIIALSLSFLCASVNAQNISIAMGGKSSGVGRTIVMPSFLLVGPSGSGVATTVTVGSVAPRPRQDGLREKWSRWTFGGLLGPSSHLRCWERQPS